MRGRGEILPLRGISLNYYYYDFRSLENLDDRSTHDVKSKLHEFCNCPRVALITVLCYEA